MVLFFAGRMGHPSLDPFFVEQLNRALRVCNLDPALYKSHSFQMRSDLGRC